MTASPARVFVVDDDAVLLFTLTGILRAAGYSVESFEHPAALLDRLTPRDRGALVLDLEMPGYSGLELQSLLGSRGIMMPMIFISGRASIPAAVAAMKQGAIDFLPKPVQPEALREVVARALQRDATLHQEHKNAERFRERWALLSPREQAVCRLSAQGLAHKQIAAELGTALSTVQTQRTSAYRKLDLDSPVELARLIALVEITR